MIEFIKEAEFQQYIQAKEQIKQLQAQIKEFEDKLYAGYPIKSFAFVFQGEVYIVKRLSFFPFWVKQSPKQ